MATPRRVPPLWRWVTADARDVARIDAAPVAPSGTVASVARGVARWQARVERRRLVALLRRGALVGLVAACALQVGAIAAGHAGAGTWLVPAGLVVLVCLAAGLAQRTTGTAVARMLDRDLGLGAEVSTALELERAGGGSGLGALAIADGRAALAQTLAGGRARLRPRHGEIAAVGVLALALGALLLVPARAPHASVTAAPSHVAKAGTAASASGGTATTPAPVGATLHGYTQTPVNAPPLASIASGSKTGAAAASQSPYGGGIANNSAPGSVEPVSKTVGKAGAVERTPAAGTSSPSASEGASARGTGTVGGGGAKGSARGAEGAKGNVSSVAGGAGEASQAGQQGAGKTPGKASATGGGTKGGGGSSAPGRSQGHSGQSTPGGATAGATKGSRTAGTAVVPQLGASKGLPIQPGYEAASGTKGGKGESASATAGGGGGESHSGQSTGGAGAGSTGVPYVSPDGGTVAAGDRQLLLGYFGSFSRVTSSGW